MTFHTTRCIQAFDTQIMDDVRGAKDEIRCGLSLSVVQLYLQRAMFKIVRPIGCRDRGGQVRIVGVIGDINKVSVPRVEVDVEQLSGTRWACD